MSKKTLLRLHAAYVRALDAASNGKSYTIGNRTLTYQDITDIRAELDRLEDQLDALEGKPTGIGFIYMRSVR